MIVAKFGGSSVASAEQFKKVKDIVLSNSERSVVVVSALGKKTPDDIKTTDLLYALHSKLVKRKPYGDIYEPIKNNFYDICERLSLTIDMVAEFNELEDEFTPHISKDYIITCGEYFTAKMMANYLDYDFVDAVELIRFNDDGSVDKATTYSLIQKAIKVHPRMVVPGFYGAFSDGTVKAFPRGGSDITGAILAAALNADCYENWTDVSGVLSADPRIINGARKISKISYAELRELTYMGASVLHDEAIEPVRELKIPIHIKNTNFPDDPGTIVSGEMAEENYFIKGITGKRGYTVINVKRKPNASKMDVLKHVVKVFQKQSFEQISDNIDSLDLIFPSLAIKGKTQTYVDKLYESPYVANVSIYENLSLISVLGRHFKDMPEIIGKVFTALGDEEIDIKLIAHGIDELSIIVGIDDDDFVNSVNCIYSELNGEFASKIF